jgi:hypothetical protein
MASLATLVSRAALGAVEVHRKTGDLRLTHRLLVQSSIEGS